MASERQVAVALRFLREQEDAPRVVAKGRGALAEKILEIAKANNVPIHRDTDLVEVLARLDLDQFIPAELYQAVAEILAHLYRLNQKKAD